MSKFSGKSQRDKVSRRLAAIHAASRAPESSLADVKLRSRRTERSQRAKMFRPAELWIARGAKIPCIIRDFNDGGARIAMEGAFPLPPQAILKASQAGLYKKVRVIWQNENEAGLQFAGDIARKPRPKPDSMPAPR